MQVKIIGLIDSPIHDEDEIEVVVFEGSINRGKVTVETNRYHRLEVVLKAERDDDDDDEGSG